MKKTFVYPPPLHTPQSGLRPASSPNLGELLRYRVSRSSPKLGEGDRREAVVEECVLPTLFAVVRALIAAAATAAVLAFYGAQ